MTPALKMGGVITSTATVYRAPVPGAQRRLTQRAAYNDWARWYTKERCSCEPAEEPVYRGFNCHLHERCEISERLARWLMWRDDQRAARRYEHVGCRRAQPSEGDWYVADLVATVAADWRRAA